MLEMMKNREELPLVLNALNLLGRGVEVGTQYGLFASHILKYWKGQKLYLVDAWRQFDNYNDVANLDNNGQLDCLTKTFMNTYIFQDRVAFIRDLSVGAAELFENNSLDFVYLDADHSYAGCKKDLFAWFSKIKKGGLFGGHDFINSSKDINGCADFGVKEAVEEFANKNNLKVFSTTRDDNFIDGGERLVSWFILV